MLIRLMTSYCQYLDFRHKLPSGIPLPEKIVFVLEHSPSLKCSKTYVQFMQFV